MKVISLLPADSYIVINKTILTSEDKNNLISLYEPIIGPIAVCLYLTLWRDLDTLELISPDFNHHHLMISLKSSLEIIKNARETLESFGLLRTYYKEGSVNHYVYELYSPLSAKEFFRHPIFSVLLYNNVGKTEYENIKKAFIFPFSKLENYEEITRSLDETYLAKAKDITDDFPMKGKNYGDVNIRESLDFDMIIAAVPKVLINKKMFNDKNKEFLNQLAFIYNLNNEKMIDIIRTVIIEKLCLDKDALRKLAQKTYEYENNGSLPTLIYKSQPEYLKSSIHDDSNKGKIINVFENTSPFEFLKSKYKGVKPSSRDLKILEYLILDLELKPAVVNVLIDYVLKINNNKLTKGYVEVIAGQWKRSNVKTALEAMELAESEYRRQNKKERKMSKTPTWFDKEEQKENLEADELRELEEMFKDVRSL